jgi:hypothetical protein
MPDREKVRPRAGAAHRLPVDELMTEAATRLSMAEAEDAYEDGLDAASNAVVHLVRAAGLDEADAAARDLLVRFPDVHDGWDRLGMVHEARGDSRQAADCYRKVIDFIRQRPNDYSAGMIEQFANLVERLDPPVAS